MKAVLSSQNQSTLLLVVVWTLTWSFTATTECADGEVRDSLEYRSNTDDYGGEVEYCRNGKWNKVCSNSSNNWTEGSATVVCRQLGYSDQTILVDSREGRTTHELNTVTSGYMTIECNGTEESLELCNVSDCSCSECTRRARAACRRACFPDGEIRLVGGSTNREGRVEVCMDGRWGTVCNNSQEGIESSICYQAGFSRLSAATTSSNATIKPVRYQCVFDEDDNNCIKSNSTHCDLAVTCLTHEEVTVNLLNALNESNSALHKLNESYTGTTLSQSKVFPALLSVTVVILIAVTSGWIATCVVQWNKRRYNNSHRADGSRGNVLYLNEQYPNQSTEDRDGQLMYEQAGFQTIPGEEQRESSKDGETVVNKAYVRTTHCQEDESDTYDVVEQKKHHNQTGEVAKKISASEKPHKHSEMLGNDRNTKDSEFYTFDDSRTYAVVNKNLK